MQSRDSSAKSASFAWVHLILSALVLFRTLPFALYGSEVIDADEGLFGLMAKQLSEGRAFPIYGYGTRYNMALNSWFAAPFMKIFGSSVFTLKLPLILLNLAVVNLTALLLKREARLTSVQTLICCLLLALPSFEASRGLMDACIGGIEPFFFLLLIWILRERPWVAGAIAGLAAAQRPYILYGMASIFLIRLKLESLKPENLKLQGALKKLISPAVKWLASMGVVSLLIHFVAVHYSSNYFGVGSPATLKRLRFIFEDARGYLAETIPQTLGLQVQSIHRPVFILRNELAQGSHFDLWGLVFAGLGVVLLICLFRWIWLNRKTITRAIAREELRFPFYLVGVGFFSFIAHILLSPPSPDIRFTFLMLFGFVGVYALRNSLGTHKWVGQLATVFALGCVANNLFALSRGWRDLIALERDHPSKNLIQYLKDHQVTATQNGFFSAYNLAFLSNEAISVTDGDRDHTRIPANADIFSATPPQHRAHVDAPPCTPQPAHVENWYVCLDSVEK